MELFEDKELFKQAIDLTSNYYHIDSAIIEKDYFVTLLLREINNSIDGLVFKGGTSLSKCYKVIDRFSEDIDLTLDPKKSSRKHKKDLVKAVIKACHKFNLTIVNEDKIVPFHNMNAFDVAYDHYSTLQGINPNIKIETVFFIPAYPFESKYASCLIYDYLKRNKQDDFIKQYNLVPFKINVQSIKRTFIDKTFAICDYFKRGELDKRCRHIYDLYKLFPHITFNEEFISFVKEVRSERQKDEMCLSAVKGFDINKCLIEILDTDAFKTDFIKFTKNMVYEDIDYDEFKMVLKWIVESKAFIE